MVRARGERNRSCCVQADTLFLARSASVCCPYPFVAVPAVLAYIALIFTWLAAIICKFFIITVGGEQGNLLVGLWSVESPEPWTIQASDTYCRPWNDGILLNDDDLDGALNAARAFGIISGVLGTIAFIMILVPSCVMFDDNAGNCYLRTLCCLCLFTGIATLLDLVSRLLHYNILVKFVVTVGGYDPDSTFISFNNK